MSKHQPGLFDDLHGTFSTNSSTKCKPNSQCWSVLNSEIFQSDFFQSNIFKSTNKILVSFLIFQTLNVKCYFNKIDILENLISLILGFTLKQMFLFLMTRGHAFIYTGQMFTLPGKIKLALVVTRVVMVWMYLCISYKI